MRAPHRRRAAQLLARRPTRNRQERGDRWLVASLGLSSVRVDLGAMILDDLDRVVAFVKRRRILGREVALAELDELLGRAKSVATAGDSDDYCMLGEVGRIDHRCGRADANSARRTSMFPTSASLGPHATRTARCDCIV